MHQCGYCTFKSNRKYNLKIHEQRIHKNLTNHATPTISVQQNVNQASSNIQNHKIYFNNNIPDNETKIIQEAIQINGAPNHEPHHNIQSGAGSVVNSNTHILIEEYNEAVKCAISWKNNCEKLEEDNYVKDQSVKIRDGQLQNQNIKLQDEIVKNNNLQG